MASRSYDYAELSELCRRGLYPAAPVRAASGRLNWLMGVPPRALAEIRRAARAEGAGLVIIGSRVSGPRLRQGTLHPALAACLPLTATRRAASALRPAEEGVEIDKTVVKDYGLDDPRTSDLSLLIVHPSWGEAERRACAERLERRLAALGLPFPLRVFASLHETFFRDEAHFLEVNGAFLHGLQRAPARFAARAVAEASRELYMTVNLPRRALSRGDLGNAALVAALTTASFSAAFGFHPVFPATGFVFGLFGRYLARLRAGAAFRLGDGALGNAAALGVDAGIGAAAIAALINPAAGLGLALPAIAANSAAHALGRGGLRVWLDKRFSVLDERRQGLGVALAAAATFVQGLATSFAYAGSKPALLVQAASAALGLGLLFAAPLKRLAGR